jgi:hypothetical protein
VSTNSLPDGCPAVFGVLAVMLTDAEVDASELGARLEQLGGQFDDPGMPENRFFGPWVLYLLAQRNLESHLPAALAEKLHGTATLAAAKALARDVVLQRIGAAFEGSGIEALLLKGAALEGYLYERQAFRLGVDVDLLVRASDYDRALGVLSTMGQPAGQFTERPAHSSAGAQAAFVVAGPAPVGIDLHREYAQQGIWPIDYEALFQRSGPHPARPAPFRLLSPEDNLVHFAIHAFKERRLYQKQTIDAYLLMTLQRIDWPIVLERARSAHALWPLAYLLEGVRRVFEWQLPEEVRRPLELRGLRRLMVDRFLTHREAVKVRTGPVYRFRQLVIAWALSGNLAGHLRYQQLYLRNLLRDACRGPPPD